MDLKQCITIAGRKQVEAFVNAVERSLKYPVSRRHVKAEVLSGPAGLEKLSLLRKQHGL